MNDYRIRYSYLYVVWNVEYKKKKVTYKDLVGVYVLKKDIPLGQGQRIALVEVFEDLEDTCCVAVFKDGRIIRPIGIFARQPDLLTLKKATGKLYKLDNLVFYEGRTEI